MVSRTTARSGAAIPNPRYPAFATAATRSSTVRGLTSPLRPGTTSPAEVQQVANRSGRCAILNSCVGWTRSALRRAVHNPFNQTTGKSSLSTAPDAVQPSPTATLARRLASPPGQRCGRSIGLVADNAALAAAPLAGSRTEGRSPSQPPVHAVPSCAIELLVRLGPLPDAQRQGGAVLSLTTRLVASSTLRLAPFSSSSPRPCAKTKRTAVAAISARGWRTVVRGGEVQLERGRSSKPTRLRSVGTGPEGGADVQPPERPTPAGRSRRRLPWAARETRAESAPA